MHRSVSQPLGITLAGVEALWWCGPPLLPSIYREMGKPDPPGDEPGLAGARPTAPVGDPRWLTRTATSSLTDRCGFAKRGGEARWVSGNEGTASRSVCTARSRGRVPFQGTACDAGGSIGRKSRIEHAPCPPVAPAASPVRGGIPRLAGGPLFREHTGRAGPSARRATMTGVELLVDVSGCEREPAAVLTGRSVHPRPGLSLDGPRRTDHWSPPRSSGAERGDTSGRERYRGAWRPAARNSVGSWRRRECRRQIICRRHSGWLGCRDSNPNYLIQSQASYR